MTSASIIQPRFSGQCLSSSAILVGFGQNTDWNFEKFLIGPQGTLEARFKSSTDPENPELTAKIEALLAAKNKSELRGESLHNGPTR